ncbi:hypothetical protein EZS27_023194 [termite gut metagenome]|uniref:Uncharacterized protein n=1 Tax=termite gut metagenome TaxID=433724 RepID=A0A5J4R3J4_9ZZZZ
MEQLIGIEYEKDATGQNRYLRVDIERYGENEALQDFLDGIEIMSRKEEPTISLEEFNRRMDDHFKINV